MKRLIFGLTGACAAFLLAWSPVFGSEPVPSLKLGFSKSSDGLVKAERGELTLKIGRDAKVKDGALNVVPGSDQVSVADPAAFRKWASKVDTREIAASFWIRFDDAFFGGKTNVADFALFDCSIDAERHIVVKVNTKRTELMKPVTMTSRLQAEFGKWYHVEFSYSMNSRRYALYIDGRFQMENDILMMPLPGIRDLKPDGTFRGAVKDLRFYEAALISEELALTNPADTDFEALRKQAATIVASTKNQYLKTWAEELAQQTDVYQERTKKQDLPVASYKNLAKMIGNAGQLAERIASGKDVLADQIVTTYSVPVTSQDLYLPYDLPKSGELTKKLDVIMAQNEFESASVIFVPFRPVKNFTVKMGDLRNGKHVMKGSDVDVKIVKRWYRTGGAWLTYHVDLYMRAFVPDMLLNDEKLVRVDETRRTNHVLFHYPGGDHYTDVSEFLYENKFMSPEIWQYFYDAPELCPVEFKEAGRNRQYVITFHADKNTQPGFYEGK